MNTPEEQTANKLNVTFEGPDIHNGTSLEDFQKTLTHVQNAVRNMVKHLDGNTSNIGRPSDFVRNQSNLRIVGISEGSLVAELELPAPTEMQHDSENFGQQAIRQILSWRGEPDDSLPPNVAQELRAIGTDISQDVQSVQLGDPTNSRFVKIERRPTRRRRGSLPQTFSAVLYGSLKEINWHKRTAQLHRFNDAKHIPLQFSNEISDDMRRLATKYVKVTGRGKLNSRDQWVSVNVREIESTRSDDEEFDLDSFLGDREPQLFDPRSIVTATEPFDVNIFVRDIHEARDVAREMQTD